MKKKFVEKRRTIRIIIIILLLFALVVAMSSYLMRKYNVKASELFGKLPTVKRESGVDSFQYDKVDYGEFDTLGDGIVILSKSQIQILNGNGEKTVSESISYTNPVLTVSNGFALTYDAGKLGYSVFNIDGEMYKGETEKSIISGSINDKGWSALCTEETGYNGLVTVYNSAGAPVYKWHSGEGYVLDAGISAGSKKMAVLTVSESGSRISFFELKSEDKIAEYKTDDLILAIQYMKSGDVMAITESSIITVNDEGKQIANAEFSGRYISGFSLDGKDRVIVTLKEYQAGENGKIISVDSEGTLLGEAELIRNVDHVSSSGVYSAVLGGDTLTVYGRDMEVFAAYKNISGACGMSVRDDGSAIVFGDYSAKVYRKID